MKVTSWNHRSRCEGSRRSTLRQYLSAPNDKTPQQIFEAQLLAAAKAKSVCNNLSDALAVPTLTQPALSLLPAEHPAKVEASLLVFSHVPPALQWVVGVTLGSHTRSFTVAELQYHKLALRFPGATATDDALIQTAGGILNVAPFQVQVAGSLRLDGVEVQRFESTTPGESQVLTVSVTGPTPLRLAESPHSRGCGVHAVSLRRHHRRGVCGFLKAAVSKVSSDDNSEAAGYAAAALYASQQQRSAQRAFALQGHATFQDVLEALAGKEISVQESFGIPVALGPGLYTLDVGRDALTPVPMDTNPSQVPTLVGFSGTQGSVLEAHSWETVFANPGIATVPIIQQANAQGITVFNFNGGSASGLTGYTQGSLDDVAQALAANWRVTIPQHPVTVPGYVNVEAYILFNPVDGSGNYVINHTGGGGNNGSGTGTGPQNGPACSCNNGSGNSTINLANGRLHEEFSDLALPAVGLPIAFTRHYTNQFKTLTSLGVGWLHTYGIFLRPELNGDVTFVTEDTTEVRFVKTGSTFAIPAGWYYALTQNAGGFQVRSKDGYVWQFDSSGRLTKMQDTSGNATTLVYSGAQLSAVNDSSGATALSFSYTGNKLTSVTDRAGRSVSFSYTGDDLTSATDALGHAEMYGYDGQHLLTSRTDRRGQQWLSFYDAFGRWTGAQDANGQQMHAVFDTVHLTTVLFDRTGAAWRSVHNAAGNPIEKTSPLGETTTTTWVAQQPTSSSDGRGFTTSMQYDTLGNLLKRTAPDGRIDTMTYDTTFNHVLTKTSSGLPNVINTYDTAGRLKTRNAGLGVTTYNYDPKGQLSTVVEPGPATTTFGHDAAGNVTSILDASGRTTSMGFDPAGHVTAVTDGNSKTRTLEVDALGRVNASIDATHARTEMTYDNEGHRLTTKDAAGAVSSFAYDGVGRMTSATDTTGKTSRTEYDALGRMTATVDALRHRSTRSYDAAGRLVSTTDALGNVMTHAYCADLGSSPCAEVDALGNLTTRDFDEVGRVTSTVDALGRQTVSQYDTGGRLSVQNGPGQPQTTYGYSSATGLLSTVTTPALAVAYLYDNRGNRTQVTAASSQVTKYTYDLANRLLTETNPLNQVTTYMYDAAGNRCHEAGRQRGDDDVRLRRQPQTDVGRLRRRHLLPVRVRLAWQPHAGEGAES